MASLERLQSIPYNYMALLVLALWVEALARSAAEPIKITRSVFLDKCIPGRVEDETFQCCPPKYTGKIATFKVPASATVRTRRALQCLTSKESADYKAKLHKAYTILRSLPADDPRSLAQIRNLHCAYGTGSFVQPSNQLPIDIHFGWFFLPWHRYFVYFHERLLQSVLDESDFTLHFWNWDNPDNATRGKGCFAAGNTFPGVYNDPATAQYERRNAAVEAGQIVSLATPVDTLDTTDVAAVLAFNEASLHESMVRLGNTTRGFMGRPYRVGDTHLINKGLVVPGGGSLEVHSHIGVHTWTSRNMSRVDTAAGDPCFYAHHANVDRLWARWHGLPNGTRRDWDDPDFLNAEFLFWDEKGILTKVKVKDSLDMKALGYKYEPVNDYSWIY